MTKREIISLVLKAIVAIAAIVGTILCAVGGNDTFMGGPVVFMYFTIQSNIALAITCIIGAIVMLLKKDVGHAGAICKLVATVSITLTGFVFCFVLAPTFSAGAWTIQNILTHVIVPVCSIIDLFVIGKDYEYKKPEVFYILIPPLLYTIFAGIGYAANWNFGNHNNYPYFFLNWGSKAKAFGFSNELPFMGCVYWIIVLMLFLLGVGYLYAFLLKKLRKENV